MILYKYRRDSETTEGIFTSKKVWLSTPAQLNDPFEGTLHEIDAAWISAKVKELKHAQLAGFLDAARHATTDGAFFGLTRNQLRNLLQRFGSFRDFDQSYAAFRDFVIQRIGTPPSDPEKVFSLLGDQLSAVGIFSLSEVPDHPLMWAHYTEDHKGLCLGFHVTDGSALTDHERCLRVDYADSLPKMGDGFKHQMTLSRDDRGNPQVTSRVAFSDPAVRAAISTKPVDWRYEREWRYIEPLAGAYNWPGPIVEVTFGLRCPQARRDYYSKLTRDSVPNDVRFYEMRKVPNKNSLERVRLPASTSMRTLPAEAISSEVSIEAAANLIESQMFSQALPKLEQLLADAPDSAELWRLKGIALGESGDHLSALECFDRAIRLQPDFFSAWYQRGVALTQLRQYDDAIDAYLRAQKLDPTEASVAFNLGAVLVHLQRYDEACVHLQAAQKLGHPRAAYVLQALEEGSKSHR